MEKESLDELDGIIVTLLIDLSKAYDCANHGLIIAKLAAYGLNKSSLRLIQNYLSKENSGKTKFSPERIARNFSRCPSGVNIGACFI